jgi:hypothetical protein
MLMSDSLKKIKDTKTPHFVRMGENETDRYKCRGEEKRLQ